MAPRRSEHFDLAVTARPAVSHTRRRGTAMVYVLGILTLVGLIGLILIARTHGELKRVVNESSASSLQVAADGLVRCVQETLHRDIWGPTGQAATPLSQEPAVGLQETNEPYDAPGPDDRWLASLLPHYLGRRIANTFPTAVTEEDVLAWHHVSYLGTDLLRQAAPTFAWAFNRRTTNPGSGLVAPTLYADSSLENVQILQTPIPGWETAPMIPGSTTNVTIAEARETWEAVDQPLLEAAGLDYQFPYFDTNADGQVDLYDADGDGIPDSPISVVLRLDSADPNSVDRLYAVVRIVDHGGMLNVNVASSWRLPDGELTFDETAPGLQRRGRRATELLLDELTHADDAFAAGSYAAGYNRTADLVDYRWPDTNPPAPYDPVVYDEDIVRSKLVGGWLPDSRYYFLYGLGDEAALRHRGLLASYDLRNFDKVTATSDYRTIDRALRWTLLWTPEKHTEPLRPFSYLPNASPADAGNASRWTRLNADYQPAGSTTWYEGFDGPGGSPRGWRTLLQEDHPAAIRRPLFTTVSHEVVPPPHGVVLGQGGTTVQGLSNLPVRFPNGLDPNAYLVMTWLVLDRPTYPDLADWMRVQPININLSLVPTPPNELEQTEEVKELFIRQVAAAAYLALDGVSSFQDIRLTDDPGTPENEALNRQWLAWQFAVNMADYRDSDSEPTVLEWAYANPGEQDCYLFGLEKQPFLTEAYAYLVAGEDEPGPEPHNPTPDSWFFAVELFVPPLWVIPTDSLYIRAPGETGLLRLDSFHLGGLTGPPPGLPGPPPVLDGGADGAYFVLCGDPTHAPVDLLNPLEPHNTSTFYQNAGFKIAIDGHGRVELVYKPADPSIPDCVLDAIGPDASGGTLAAGSRSGVGIWAMRPPNLPSGRVRAYSLLRSTKGWRFTTGWQVFTERPVPANLPDPPMRRSLGSANETFDSLDDNVPESIWPTLVSLRTTGHEPVFGPTGAPGFASGVPYEAFDSVGEISRLLMIGPIKFNGGPPYLPSHLGLPTTEQPATVTLAKILDAGPTGDLPGPTNERIAAGRVDFVNAKKAGPSSRRNPWTWRFFDYFTVQSPLYDGIDNDGDGAADWGYPLGVTDPTEGADVLYRMAGRININTAPLSVLRCLPFMSLLPTSSVYQEFDGDGMLIHDPVQAYLNPLNAGVFWDLAGTIVATREGRPVPLRLLDITTGALQTVAVADRHPLSPSTGPFSRGAFTNMGELATLTTIVDNVNGDYTGGNQDLYRVDRFWWDSTLPLWNHVLPGSPDPDLGNGFGSAYSPDYRYRGDNGVMDYIPIFEPPQAASDPLDAGGIRGRDIFLARWANLLTTRSDVFTAYIALLDEDGNYVHRTQVTLDRSECFREVPVTPGGAAAGERRIPVLPRILTRTDGSYADDTR